ncbi:hypothetical protein GGS21DRAFT_506524 [Xylaria nigripes]|nr:hypothetical protein GGS21DRAFT_506524 [Xylaria nigripes]
MFGGFAPPQLSKEEIRILEREAGWTVKSFFVTAAVLYICMPPPLLPTTMTTTTVLSHDITPSRRTVR